MTTVWDKIHDPKSYVDHPALDALRDKIREEFRVGFDALDDGEQEDLTDQGDLHE